MKLFFTLILSLIICSSLAQALRLDDPNSERDYIPIAKPNRSQNTYHFQHPVLTRATISARRPKRGDPYDGADVLYDMLSDLFLTKLNNSSSTSTDMTWLVRANITCNEGLLNWALELYVNGTLEKVKTRTEDHDGSVSKSTKKTILLDWNTETIGIIMENNLLISKFILFKFPRLDSLIVAKYSDAFERPENTDGYSERRYRRNDFTFIEFAVIGKLRGDDFAIISNAATKDVSLYLNGELTGIFQPDLDDLSIEMKGEVMPHLLVNSDVSDESIIDWLRLSMISKYLLRTIEKSTYKKL